jgi:hypothetical protein
MNTKIGSWLFAILLSIGSAYYSITGLVALFPTIAIDMIILCSIIEASKLWSMHSLISKWDSLKLSFKIFFISLIVSLSLLTSIGVYGHLSKGHLEQLLPNTENALVITQLKTDITQLDKEAVILAARQDSLNSIEMNQLSGDKISKNRLSVVTEKKALKQEIVDNNIKKQEISKQLLIASKANSRVESELGTIKYFADLVGLDSDNAIKLIIILIMMGLEPMILAHVIMASMKEQAIMIIPPVIEVAEAIEEKPKPKRVVKRKEKKDANLTSIANILDEPVKIGTYADIKKKISNKIIP